MSHINRKSTAIKTVEHRTTVCSEQLTHAKYVLSHLLGSALSEQGKKDYQDSIDLIDAELCKRDM